MSLDALIQDVLAEAGYAENPYFVALRDGSLSRVEFVETQVQFYFAVEFFSRPMAAVAARIPESHRRIEVLRNVWEEHGEGDRGMAHGTTFLAFLERLAGLEREDVVQHVLWPEVRMFNTTLVGAAVLDEYLVSVGMMGIIERMFVDISGWIRDAVVARGWLEAERIVHYSTHETLDEKHSEDFFAVLRPAWNEGVSQQNTIAQGLRLGAAAFDNLYRGLHRGRIRRWRLPAGT